MAPWPKSVVLMIGCLAAVSVLGCTTTTTNDVTGEEEETTDWLTIGLVTGGAVLGIVLIRAAVDASHDQQRRAEAEASRQRRAEAAQAEQQRKEAERQREEAALREAAARPDDRGTETAAASHCLREKVTGWDTTRSYVDGRDQQVKIRNFTWTNECSTPIVVWYCYLEERRSQPGISCGSGRGGAANLVQNYYTSSHYIDDFETIDLVDLGEDYHYAACYYYREARSSVLQTPGLVSSSDGSFECIDDQEAYDEMLREAP